MKTCSCGNILKGFDKIRGAYCSECIRKDTNERQNKLLEKETNDLYALAIAACIKCKKCKIIDQNQCF